MLGFLFSIRNNTSEHCQGAMQGLQTVLNSSALFKINLKKEAQQNAELPF
jgi:hypothetical protein